MVYYKLDPLKSFINIIRTQIRETGHIYRVYMHENEEKVRKFKLIANVSEKKIM